MGAYRTGVPLHPGLSAEVELTVTDADTAIAIGSGNVAVLATPRVVALCEETSVKAVQGHLPEGCTTVGMRIQLDHLAPTPVGQSVVCESTLESFAGRRVIFTVSVNDARGLVAAGKITRVIVDLERFMEKAAGA